MTPPTKNLVYLKRFVIITIMGLFPQYLISINEELKVNNVEEMQTLDKILGNFLFISM